MTSNPDQRDLIKPAGIIVMGVSGCGKSTVGSLLAARLGWEFYDADDFHPPENIAKMSAGIPLTDTDRAPWLDALHHLLQQSLRAGRHPVLACSALKEQYRQTLLAGNEGLRIIHLCGGYAAIQARLTARSGHYMKPELLQSQFAALEEPSDAWRMDITPPPDEIVERILQQLF